MKSRNKAWGCRHEITLKVGRDKKLGSNLRLGLVLSGGGACGAYEVGVIRVLSRWGLSPQVISGASIGALNGAVLASSPRFRLAADRLESLWEALDTEEILRLRDPSKDWGSKYDLEASEALCDSTSSAHEQKKERASESKARFDQAFALLDEDPMASILSKSIDLKQLRKGPDLYISIFPGDDDPGLFGAILDLIHWLRADRRSEFVRIKDYSDTQILTLLKASAAIPLAFKPQPFCGRIYRDGGIGAQGNTPIQPLCQTDCTHGIVIVLDHRFPLNPAKWPTMELVEIRPSQNLQEDGLIRSILDFSPKRIRELIQLGEEDALSNPGLKELKKKIGLRTFFWSLRW